MPINEDVADDAYLVGRAQDGYVDAFRILASRHRDRIYRTALRLTGNTSDAEDIAQDVLVKAWQHLNGFRGDASFTSWLYRITLNQAHRHRSRQRYTIDRAKSAALGRAIAALPAEQREPLVLHQFEGLPYQEVATILKISEATVRGRLSRARRALANTLREWA